METATVDHPFKEVTQVGKWTGRVIAGQEQGGQGSFKKTEEN